MEEKIISKSKQYNIKKVRNIIWLTGLALAVAFMLLNISEIQHFLSAEYVAKYGPGDGILDIVLFLVIFGGSGLIIGQVFYSCMSKVSLTITDKRVYGTAAFGKRVDLPLDSISAVGTSAFKGIAITSASGAIKFGMVKNRDEIHSAISKLLVERQNKPVATTTIKQEIPQSNAKELKNYKELLDMGVISQEEFDAKKKQLLGL